MATPAFNPNAAYSAPAFDPTAAYQSTTPADTAAPDTRNAVQKSFDALVATPTAAEDAQHGPLSNAIAHAGAGVLQSVEQPLVHPIQTAESLGNALVHPVNTAESMAKGALADPARAAGSLLGGAVLGDAASAAAGAVNDIASPIAGRVALLGKTPEAAYESALKPSTTLPASTRANIVQAGLKEAVPVSKAGVDKIGDLINDYNQKISDTINSAGPNRTISPGSAVQNLQSVRSKFATQVNPTSDLNAIDASGDEFLNQFRSTPGGAVRNMTAPEAQAMKQGTYRVLAGKYGEQGSAAVEAQKALARGLKDEIANQFPEITKLNADESKLLDLQPVLERAVNRISNHQLIGIGTPIAGSAVKAVTGSGSAGAIASALKAVLDNPAVKSRLAIAVSRGAKIPFAQAAARVGAYSAAVGSYAGSPANTSQADQ